MFTRTPRRTSASNLQSEFKGARGEAREVEEGWGWEGGGQRRGGVCVVSAVLSFERERELVFRRWLSEVERLPDGQVDRDAAYEAWTDGYSASEYAVEVEWGRER
jgi:hypothetical protein